MVKEQKWNACSCSTCTFLYFRSHRHCISEGTCLYLLHLNYMIYHCINRQTNKQTKVFLVNILYLSDCQYIFRTIPLAQKQISQILFFFWEMCVSRSCVYCICRAYGCSLWVWGREKKRLTGERGYFCVSDRGDSVSVACDTQRSLCSSQASLRDGSQWTTSPVCFLHHTAQWLTAGLLCVPYCVCMSHFSVSVCIKPTDG